MVESKEVTKDKYIRNLIAENKLKKAISEIRKCAESSCEEANKNAIVISFSIHLLHDAATKGIINFEEYNKLIIQIVNRMLNLLENIEIKPNN